jgi:hypothetical protein
MSTVRRLTGQCLTSPRAHLCPLDAEWSYDAADPLVVVLVIRAQRQGTVRWELSREVLASAVAFPGYWVGALDVHARVMGEVLEVDLRVPSGEALLTCPLGAAQDFLIETYDLCPESRERALVASELDGWQALRRAVALHVPAEGLSGCRTVRTVLDTLDGAA